MSGEGGMTSQSPGEPKQEQPVGYASPPAEHKFKKGKSGNPAGRPRKKRPNHRKSGQSILSDTQNMWLEEAATLLQISVNGKVQTVSAVDAVKLSLRQKALTGGIMAQRTYLAYVKEAELAVRQVETQSFETYIEYKDWADAEIRLRKAAGLSFADILPHPDDVIIGPRTGFFAVVGPVDEYELANYETQLLMLEQMQEDVSEAAVRHAAASKRNQATLLELWHRFQARYDKLNDILPPSLQPQLRDRSTAPGASKAGDYFQHTSEQIEALRQSKGRGKVLRRAI